MGNSRTDVWAADNNGNLFQYDGTVWMMAPYTTTNDIRGIDLGGPVKHVGGGGSTIATVP